MTQRGARLVRGACRIGTAADLSGLTHRELTRVRDRAYAVARNLRVW